MLIRLRGEVGQKAASAPRGSKEQGHQDLPCVGSARSPCPSTPTGDFREPAPRRDLGKGRMERGLTPQCAGKCQCFCSGKTASRKTCVEIDAKGRHLGVPKRGCQSMTPFLGASPAAPQVPPCKHCCSAAHILPASASPSQPSSRGTNGIVILLMSCN